MSDQIFTPFTPAAPPLSPAAEPPKAKRARKAAEPQGAKIKPPKRKRVVKAVNEVPPETPAETPAPRKKRKPRAVPKVRTPRSMKLPVATMLSAMGALRGDDATLFEKLLGILAGAAKGQRQRVLGALGKVFA
jgi:hypothetical protein